MKFRTLSLIVILILGLSPNVNACSFTPESFCRTANVSKSNDLMVMATISQKDTLGIDIEIIQILRGQEDKSYLRIWDGTDFDCNGLHSMAASDLGNVSDTLILLLPKIDSIENSWDVIGDYRRPDPYSYTTSLKVNQGFVNGLINGLPFSHFNNITSMDLDDFLTVPIDEMGCASILSNDELDEIQFSIYPNPAADYIHIRSNQIRPETTFKIINTSGQTVKLFTLRNEYDQIDISNLRPGMYAILNNQHQFLYFVKS